MASLPCSREKRGEINEGSGCLPLNQRSVRREEDLMLKLVDVLVDRNSLLYLLLVIVPELGDKGGRHIHPVF